MYVLTCTRFPTFNFFLYFAPKGFLSKINGWSRFSYVYMSWIEAAFTGASMQHDLFLVLPDSRERTPMYIRKQPVKIFFLSSFQSLSDARTPVLVACTVTKSRCQCTSTATCVSFVPVRVIDNWSEPFEFDSIFFLLSFADLLVRTECSCSLTKIHSISSRHHAVRSAN